MITGLVLLLLGIWLIRRSSRFGSAPDVQPKDYSEDTHDLEDRLRVLETKFADLAERNKALRQGMELDHMIAVDALRRVERSKAALEAVLLQSGCTGDDIDKVMREVDGETGEQPTSEGIV